MQDHTRYRYTVIWTLLKREWYHLSFQPETVMEYSGTFYHEKKQKRLLNQKLHNWISSRNVFGYWGEINNINHQNYRFPWCSKRNVIQNLRIGINNIGNKDYRFWRLQFACVDILFIDATCFGLSNLDKIFFLLSVETFL